MKIFYLCLSLVFFVHASDDYLLGEILVSADPIFEQNYDKLDDKDFHFFQKSDIASAASLIPGVTLTKLGARNESMITIRGFDLRQIPVLIDGIPVYLPYDGYVDLGRFFSDQYQEIQVTKDNTSILAGPNIVGGVINLVRKEATKPFGANLTIGSTFDSKGDYGASKMATTIASKKKKYNYVLSGNFHHHDHLRNGNDEKINHSETKDYGLNAKITLTPNQHDAYSLNYVNQQGEKEVPIYTGTISNKRYWEYPQWDKQSVYWMSQNKLSKQSYLKTKLFYDKLKNTLKSYDDATFSTMTFGYAFTSYYDDDVWGGNLEWGHNFQKFDLKTAFHFKRDNHKEHNAGDPIQHFSDDTYALAIEGSLPQSFSIGASYNWRESSKAQDYDNTTISDFKNNKNEAVNLQVNYFKKLSEQSRLSSSLAYRTRFPTMKDRYSYRMGQALPNPGLKEERSFSYNLGWKYANKIMLFDINLFYYDIHDTIQSISVAGGKTQMQNTGKSSTDGVELKAVRNLSPAIALSSIYSYTHKNNRSNNDYYFINSPKHFAQLSLIYTPSSRWKITPTFLYGSSRYTSSDGRQKVASHLLAHLFCWHQLNKSLKINFAVENIFNVDYQLSEGYWEAGRTYSTLMTYDF